MKNKFLTSLRALTLLLVMCLSIGNVWGGTKITDYTNLVSGKTYYIGATTSQTDYYLSVNGSSITTGVSGTAVSDKASATVFTATGSGTSWSFKFSSGNYLSLASSKANGKVNVVSDASNFTLSNSSNLIQMLIGDYAVQKNNSGTQFGSYAKTQTNVWFEEASSSDPSLSLSPTTINFGSVEKGGSVDAQNVTATLTNTTYAAATLSGDNADAFEITAGEELTETGTITVQPKSTTLQTAGTYSASLDVDADGVTGTKSATISLTVTEPFVEEGVSFEQEWSAYTDWSYKNFATKQTHSDVTPHKGSYFGSTDGKSTGCMVTKNKVNPDDISFFVTRQTTNTTSSTWSLDVSSDSLNWTTVKTQSATSMNKGTWVEVSQDLSSYSAVYVRISYNGGTAVRNIDDVVLTTRTLTKSVISKATGIEHGDVSATVGGDAVVFGTTEVSEGATVTLSNTPASGYTCTGYSVYKTGDQSTTVTVTDGKFTMPAYAVTVSATFAVGIATPELDLASGTYDGEQLALVSNYDDDYMYFYTNDGTDPAAVDLEPTGTTQEYDKDDGITISSSSTIKVVAYDLEGNHSAISTYTYTINPVYTSLAAFIEAAPDTEKSLVLNAASNVVIIGATSKNLYVQDAAGTTMILYNSSAAPAWAVGKRIEGKLTGTYTTYNGMNEMVLITWDKASAANDGVMPEPVLLTELSAETFAANKGKLIKMEDLYFQSTSISSNQVIAKDASNNSFVIYNTFGTMTSKTLPAIEDAADLTGIYVAYVDKSSNYTYELGVQTIAAGEAKINVAPEGGLDSEHAVALAKDAQVVVTPVADFTTSLNGETITEATNVTIDEAKSIVVAATRDFYTDKSVTYYYKVDASAKAVTVNQPEVGGTIAADPISASAGATITLTHSAAPHYTFGSFTVLDASSNPVTVNENEGVYTFEMPNSDVTVTGTFIENAKATATFAKGEPSATGDAPADIEWYVGENITLPANTFSFTGHKFAGWSNGANVYAAGASYEMPEGGKAFTATWEALSVWATTYTSNVTVGSDKVRFTTEGTQYDAKKAGTSSSAGSTTVTVPVGATALHFHAAGWSTEDVTLQVSKGGVAIQSFALPRDAGMNNNSPFTLANDPAQTEYFMVALSEITEETVITFAATAGKRFAIYGVNAVFPPALTLDPASKAFGEVKVGLTSEQVFTITPNAFVTGTLEAELTGTDADQFAVGAISDNQVTVTFQPDKVNASVSANLRVKSMVSSVEEAYVEAALTGVAISAETPEISLDKEVVDFGVVSQGASVAAQTVAATLTYLAEANVAVTGTAFSVSPATLTASGNITITPNTANVGVYEETLTVSGTGATAKQVTVRMTVASKWATTFTSNIDLGSSDKVTLNGESTEYVALKAGTGKTAGTVNVTFPAGVTDIHFHAVGWKGDNVTLTVYNGSTSIGAFALTADEGATSSSTWALQNDPVAQYKHIKLAEALSEETEITFTATAGYRFILFGVNQEGGPEITSISISGEATKLTYIEGEEFNPAGLTVMANYNIGGPQDVTSNSTFTFDPALLSAGQTSVSVTAHFQDFNSAPFVVNGLTVSAITLESIKLSGNYQTTFHAGEAFNHDNLVVTAIYSNEDEVDVTDDAVVSNPDMSTAGKKTVTVTYGGKEATYDIIVLAATIVFYESFDTNNGTGGNDGQWSGSIASNAITSDNEGWTFVKGNGANKCAKFGAGSTLGSAKTPEITGTGDFVLTFKAAAWNGSTENLNLVISTTNGTLSQEAVVLEKAKWNNYSIALTGVTENFQITIAAAQASNNRFFLDEVMVQKAYVRSLSSSNIGTVCVDKATSIESYSGATFYEILNKDADEKNVYFQEVVELEAGMPYIFQPSANILILPYVSEETSEAKNNNGLHGWLSDDFEFSSTIDSKEVYFVSGGKIVRCGNECTILKNRAYIVLSEISGQGSEAPGRRRLVLGVEGKGVATGMEDAIIMSNGELKKVVVDGQFYILRDGKVFDAQGKLVK